MPFRNAYYLISNMQFPLLSSLCVRSMFHIRALLVIQGSQISLFLLPSGWNKFQFTKTIFMTLQFGRFHFHHGKFRLIFASFYHVLPQFFPRFNHFSIIDCQWSYHWQYFIDRVKNCHQTAVKNRWFGFGWLLT